MAKQPKVDQVEQLIKDLKITTLQSDFPSIREQALILLPTAEKFARQLKEYYRLALR